MHYLLFTGHMIDTADRVPARFPPGKESAARDSIKKTIKQIVSDVGPLVTGIAGGACGGDILFHEICEELKIPSEVYLALPKERFLETSVAFAGPDWVRRFGKLLRRLPVFVLSDSIVLLQKPGYDIWKRNNIWQLQAAMRNGALHMTLLALWDGKIGDGSGGTEHLIKEARLKGSHTIIIDIEEPGAN